MISAMTSSFYAEVRCPLPTWADVVFNSTDNVLGSELIYRCDKNSGFSFEDESITKTSKCGLTWKWEPEITPCKGYSIGLSHLLVIQLKGLRKYQ